VKVLVAGLGNVLLGDDGFGVEVVRRLGTVPPPEGARVVDFGIRGLHLAFELLEPYDAVVLVDAVARGAPPGTLFVMEPDDDYPQDAILPDAHALHPAAVLRMARELGTPLGRVHIVGCEPASLDEGIGLSPPVAQAAIEAVRVVQRILDRVPAIESSRSRDRAGGDADGNATQPQNESPAGHARGPGAGDLDGAVARAGRDPLHADQVDVTGASRSTSST
jgi:hydrogenase maturation protease